MASSNFSRYAGNSTNVGNKRSETSERIGQLFVHPQADDIQEYVETVNIFDMIECGLKKNMIIELIGSEQYLQLKKLLAPKTLASKLFDYYSTSIPAIIQHFIFNKRDQQPRESIQDYALDLQSLANACEFGDIRDSVLRDRFIAGLRSVHLQEILLNKITPLDNKDNHIQISFEEVVRFARREAVIHKANEIFIVNQTTLPKRAKNQNDETLGKSFGRDDFQTLNDDKQDGSNKSATSGSDKKDEVQDGQNAKSKGAGAIQRTSNEHNRQSNNRPSFRNEPGRSSGSETSKDSGKKPYNNNNMNRQRNDRDMSNRNDSRNMNQYHNRNNRNSDNDGPNRNSDRDGPNRNTDRDGQNRNTDRDGPNRNNDRDGPNRNTARDGPNRNTDRDGPNRNADRDGPNRNTDRDGPIRSYNTNNNSQNRRRGDPSHSDVDNNYTGGYERFSDGRRGGRNQTSNNSRGDGHQQHGRGASGGNQNSQNLQVGKMNDPKERNYVPPTLTENEDELFAVGITSGVNFMKFDQISVNVSGEDIPPAIEAFDNSGLNDFVVQNIKRSGYTHPTPIQKNAIPIILAGRDIMACAQTGSGKTAAFLLPIISKLLTDEKPLSGNKPHVLVVSPTRELGIQIETECRKFATKSYLKTLLVYGGTAPGYQIDKANNGCHLLIATPGRLLDFVNRGILSFEDLRYLVLDEADRMLDMGFLSDIEKLMEHSSMPPPDKRQTLMFSATFPEEIQRMAGKFLNAYLFVAVGIVGGASTDVEQCVFEVAKFEKRKKLMEIIEKEEPDGIMVFVETKRNADFLASFLSEKQVLTTSMHGDRYQRQREEALNDFKSGKMKLLIATSVGARGLDIKNVRHVVNFDMPQSIDEYVHRIGRTGRVGNCGKATSFFDPEEDYSIAGDLKKILHQAGQKVPEFLMNVNVPSSKQGSNKRGNFGGKDVRKGQNQRKSYRDEQKVDTRNNQPDEPEEKW